MQIGEQPLRRRWLIFFSEGDAPAWWKCWFARGFRHVCAMAWFADQERWVYFNPGWRSTGIVVGRAAELDALHADLMARATAVLAFPSSEGRSFAPPTFFCVGAIKALLGLRSRALCPFGLYRDLLRRGAEVVDGNAVRNA